jgi:nucleoside-diphosphate-sugar epimerase
MNILLTGGAGDLGLLLAHDLDKNNDNPVRVDVRVPINPQRGSFIKGSILERELLKSSMKDIDCVVHIAAWHGFHLVSGQKNVYDFWDLNVNGTFNVFQTALEQGINKVIYISSTSVLDRFGVYGHTKVLGEEIALAYQKRHHMQVLTLRPGAFIPYWNKNVYSTFQEFALWYWKGAVHIQDVKQAVLKSIQLLSEKEIGEIPPLFIDGKYEYTAQDLQNWDAEGKGTSFRKYYGD